MTLPLSSPQPTRVLVVDDSIFMRRAIERMVNRMEGFVVVGTAKDGVEGVQRVLELRPDIVTMDVEMPRLDGVRAVQEIMRAIPTPVVMLSTLTAAGAETTIRALEAGAVDCVAKPSGMSHELIGVEQRLHEALRRARSIRALRRPASLARPLPAKKTRPAASRLAARVIVIGASTGGPPALTEVIPALPATLPAAVIVVQHMPAGFTGALARRLDAIAQLPVKEAEDGDLVANGQVLVAPGDRHLAIGDDRRVKLTETPPVHGVRPAIDVTLESAARVYGPRAVAVILTGMGRDGAEGAAEVERAGGRVFVQDEATSAIYGMPRMALERTDHARVVALPDVATALASAVGTAEGAA